MNKQSIVELTIRNTKIRLIESENVWMPKKGNPVFKMIKKISEYPITGSEILDIGSGSGLLGIYLLLNGAGNVVMTDNNHEAIEIIKKNIAINKIPKTSSYNIIESDCFEELKNEKFDYIISNPPVQPETEDIHQNNRAAKSNENGTDGRRVLDCLICEGKNYLKPEGKLITSSSSRHGHKTTKTLLDKYWRNENWKTILEIEHRVKPNYHGLYANYWLDQTNKDGDLRIFLKDQQNRKYFQNSYDKNLDWFFTYYVLEASLNG